MSAALSSFLICPSVQSLHSMRNTSPGLTEMTAGMSGCQRLCPGISCFDIGFVRSTLNSVFGICLCAPFRSLVARCSFVVSDRQQARYRVGVHVRPLAALADAAAIQHQHAIGDLQREAENLFR